MGRIKTKLIKRKTQELKKLHGDKFTADFEENKKLASRLTTISSKKLRNVVAGYLTRLIRKDINS